MAETLPKQRASCELANIRDVNCNTKNSQELSIQDLSNFLRTGNFIDLVNKQYLFIQYTSVDEMVNFQADLSLTE